MEERLRESNAQDDPSTQQLYAAVDNCAHVDAAVQRTLANLPLRVYSVGMSSENGMACASYIVEIIGMQSSGGSKAYELYGSGNCANFDYHSKTIFHPVANPAGRPPGDVFRLDYAYTGAMPDQWIYKGQTFAFGGTTAPPVKSVTPSSEAMPSQNAVSASTMPPDNGAAMEAKSLIGKPLDEIVAAADRGDPAAQTELGTRLQKGTELPKDNPRAADLYGRAAAQGNSRALTNLGWMYVLGQGVPKDDMKAIDLFNQAADRGYPNAQDSLGWMYEHGRGVAKDYSSAIAWYQRAADQGFEKSKQNIEALKAKGI